MHRKLSALLLLAHCCHSCLALLQPAVRVRRARPMSALDASKSAATIADYDAVAAAFDAGNKDHDVSQNIDALLGSIAAGRAGDALGGAAGTERPIIVDLGCAGGRDLIALTARGCEAWGVEGSPAFCALARRAAPGCTVLAQDFVDMDLPAETFDGAFANASLFHVPSEALPDVLRRIFESLKPGGVFFASNAHGFGEDKEAGPTGGPRRPAPGSAG